MPSAPWAPSATTTLAGVIGSPVRHSLSPTLFDAAFRATGLDWTYLAFEVAPGEAPAALAAMRTLGIAGLNVTMPHKDAVAAAVDVLDDAATRLGAVNCVERLDDGRLLGRNTDGPGFVRALEREGGIDPAGRRVALLGAGGAARAIAVALVGAGVADLMVVNRSRPSAERCAEVAGAVAPGVVRIGSEVDVAAADLVVNATSVGMGGTPSAGELPVPAGRLHAGQVVVDVVYHPRDTPLLRAAAASGAATLDGVGMLLHQAAIAFERWTGVAAPVAAMRDAVAARLADRA